MRTETVKLHGGNADGRWHKVPFGSTSTEARGSSYQLRDGEWHVVTAAPAPVTDADPDAPKPAPRKRKPKPPAE